MKKFAEKPNRPEARRELPKRSIRRLAVLLGAVVLAASMAAGVNSSGRWRPARKSGMQSS